MRLIRVSVIIAALFTSGCQIQAPAGVVSLHKRFQKNKQVHTVRKGETLYQIASRNGVHFRELASINGIQKPYLIRVGQKIKLQKRASSTKSTNKLSPRVINAKKNEKKVEKKSRVATTPKTVSKPNEKVKSPSESISNTQNLAWSWPVQGPIIKAFSLGKSKANGIDIGGKSGDAIVAAAAGKVVYSGNALRGYGNLIIIKHQNNFLSAYAHNRKIMVKEGENVRIRQRIAEMGQSGTDKVKLHFEVRHRGKPIDPSKVLPKR